MSYEPPPPSQQWSQPSQYAPETYLVWSVLNLVFCCLPFGIVALVFSIQCQSAITNGQLAQANDLSEKAKGWNIAATAIGVVAIVIGIAIFAIAAHAASNNFNNPQP